MEENMEDRKFNVLMDKNGYPDINYNFIFHLAKLDDEIACGSEQLPKFFSWLTADKKGMFAAYTISYVAKTFAGAEDVFRIECDYSDVKDGMKEGEAILLGKDKVYDRPVIIHVKGNEVCGNWEKYDEKSLPVSYDQLVKFAEEEEIPTLHKLQEERRAQRKVNEGDIAARVYETRRLNEKEINEGYPFYRNLGKQVQEGGEGNKGNTSDQGMQ